MELKGQFVYVLTAERTRAGENTRVEVFADALDAVRLAHSLCDPSGRGERHVSLSGLANDILYEGTSRETEAEVRVRRFRISGAVVTN